MHHAEKKRRKMSKVKGKVAVPQPQDLDIDDNGVITNPPHRPLTDINWEAAAAMLKIGATQEEIAYVFGVDPDTLNRRSKAEHGRTFTGWSNQYIAEFKVSLRRAQLRSAFGQKATRIRRTTKDGVTTEIEEEYWLLYPSVPAQIWLGKQYLGQSDKTETRFDFGTGEDEKAIWEIESVYEEAEIDRDTDNENQG